MIRLMQLSPQPLDGLHRQIALCSETKRARSGKMSSVNGWVKKATTVSTHCFGFSDTAPVVSCR